MLAQLVPTQRFDVLGISADAPYACTLAAAMPQRVGLALLLSGVPFVDPPDSFDPVERLCYIGRRGMYALEFEPERGVSDGAGRIINIPPLVELADRALAERMDLGGHLDADDDRAMQNILTIGTSAGGRACQSGDRVEPGHRRVPFRSGRCGGGHWLIKLDGVSGNRDRELADPLGYRDKHSHAYRRSQDKTARIKALVAQVADALARWPQCVEQAGVQKEMAEGVWNGFRVALFGLRRQPANAKRTSAKASANR